MNWYARMIYPHTAGTNANGHYDLQLVGNYTFDGTAYTNPVFSYGKDDDNTGFLAVFDKSLTTAIYKDFLPFKGYHYNGTTSSTNAEYQAFINAITSCIDTSTKRRIAVKNSSGTIIGYMTRYEITTSYKVYSVSSRNCFKARGIWVSALGDDRFTNFAANHSYTDYRAHAMVTNYGSLWNLQGTYTSY